MDAQFRPVTADGARQFVRWTYEPPYDIYNMVDDLSDPNLVEAAANYFLDPAIDCHVLLDEADEVLAFCTFGEDAQVPGGDYSLEAVDIGLGVRPDLTGRGLGQQFVTAVIQFASQRFEPDYLRVTIATFNERAQRVWRRQGFVIVQQFAAAVDGGRPFLILEKELDDSQENT